MIRIPVPAGSLQPGELVLPESEARRARTVLRLQEGDALELFDGAGHAASARIVRVGEQVLVHVDAIRTQHAAPPLTIAQGMPKADKLELVIQKSTELGASAIVPFAAARSVVKLDAGKAKDRVERWRKIATEAARQCGRADVPEVSELTNLAGVLARPGARALLYEGQTELRLGAFLDEAGSQPVTFIIGPEGGFADEEVEQARASGARIVGLGSRILRTETVALAVLAVALHKRGELG